MLSLLASARLIRLRPLPLTRGVQLGAHMTQDPEVMDKEKDKSLKGKVKSSIKGAPGWNEKLASVAEAVVKADREAPESIAEMQQETVDRIQQETAEDGGSGVESPRGDIENAGEMRPELRGGGSV